MGWSLRAGAVVVGALCLSVSGCGSSDASSDGGCDLVPIEAVQQAFPTYGIDKATEIQVTGASDACEFSGKPKAGAMGEYTDATTVTFTVGTFDDEAEGSKAFAATSEEQGEEAEAKQGFDVVVAEGKAVAKFDDGTYGFSSFTSPEQDDPGDEQAVSMIEVLSANR